MTGSLSVTPGEILYVEVGGKGQSQGEGGAGGFNGGGSGGGGGGGASDVRTAPRSAGLSPDTRQLIAAGGGGAGSGGPSGEGGSGGAAGEKGGETVESYEGGGAGTPTEGGLGTIGCFEPGGNGTNGERGVGGNGGYSAVESGPGGGGGGGLFGGGGGGGACTIGSGGGGGGSSLVPPGGSGGLASASAAPMVEFTYTAAAVQTPPAPAPNTFLGFHPKKKIVTTKKKVKVKFTFSADSPGATFQCKLDKGSFAPCASPKTYKVKPGKHTFSVEAVGAGGTDSTPAKFSFKVVKKAP